MLVSHVKKFIFIKAGKVAGTSVEIAFQPFCHSPDIPVEDGTQPIVTDQGIVGYRGAPLEKTPYWTNHLSSREIRSRLGTEMFDQYFKFGVVRNPWDRIVSLYEYRKKIKQTQDSFDAFCGKIKHIPLYDFYDVDNNALDYYIKFENLHEGVMNVCKKLHISYNDICVGHYKNNPHDHYSTYYNNHTRNLIADRYIKDINHFKYEFDA